MNAHQVKTEAVDVVNLDPAAHDIDDILAHHPHQRIRIVAAEGTVGQKARRRSAEIVIGHALAECGELDIVVMVEHDVQIHAQSARMQRRDQLLQFAHPAARIVGIAGIAAFRTAILQRIVAPVVKQIRMFLVDRRKIGDRHQLHMRHA